MPGNCIYSPSHRTGICPDEVMPSVVGRILFRPLARCLADSNPLTPVRTEVDTATWDRKARVRLLKEETEVGGRPLLFE